jgi:hypothetical protein
MSGELGEEARNVIAQAKRAEHRLPKDKGRVLQGVMLAVSGSAAGPMSAAGEPMATSASETVARVAGADNAAPTSSAVTARMVSNTVLPALGRGGWWKLLSLLALGASSLGLSLLQVKDVAPSVQRPESHVPLHVRADASAPLSPASDERVPDAEPAVEREARRSEQGLAAEPCTHTKQAPRAGRRGGLTAGNARGRSSTEPAQLLERPDVTPRTLAPHPPEPVAASEAPSTRALVEELRALRRAQHALVDGNAVMALDILRNVRGTSLLSERWALEVFALCALGRIDEARQRALAFRTLAPRSPLLPRIAASCAAEP